MDLQKMFNVILIILLWKCLRLKAFAGSLDRGPAIIENELHFSFPLKLITTVPQLTLCIVNGTNKILQCNMGWKAIWARFGVSNGKIIHTMQTFLVCTLCSRCFSKLKTELFNKWLTIPESACYSDENQTQVDGLAPRERPQRTYRCTSWSTTKKLRLSEVEPFLQTLSWEGMESKVEAGPPIQSKVNPAE